MTIASPPSKARFAAVASAAADPRPDPDALFALALATARGVPDNAQTVRPRLLLHARRKAS